MATQFIVCVAYKLPENEVCISGIEIIYPTTQVLLCVGLYRQCHNGLLQQSFMAFVQVGTADPAPVRDQAFITESILHPGVHEPG